MNSDLYDQFATFKYRGNPATRRNYLLIELDGAIYDPDPRPDDRPGWAAEWLALSAEDAAARREVLDRGIYWRAAALLGPAETNYERAKILGTYDGRPTAFLSRPIGIVRSYIPGLWHHNSVPMLVGPPKVGKSLLICDLAAALVIRGRRFLDHFEPIDVTPEERARPVVLVNAENPVADQHEALLATGLEFSEEPESHSYYFDPRDDKGTALFMVHLEMGGGADTFDLTNPNIYNQWEFEFSDLTRRFGRPLTIIVDGVTAILNSDTKRYGLWSSEFRRLLKSLNVPNGLPTGHTGLKTGYMMNGVESMAGQDGLWTYDSNEPVLRPRAPRHFRTVARLGGPVIDAASVNLGEDGRLRLRQTGISTARREGDLTSPKDRRKFLRDRILSLTSDNEHTWTKAVCGSGDAYNENAAMLKEMEEEGAIHKERQGRGWVWTVVELDLA